MNSQEVIENLKQTRDAVRRTRKAPQGREGGVMLRMLVASLRQLAEARWGITDDFPRSMGATDIADAAAWLTAHIALYRRAEAEGYDPYTSAFRAWVEMQEGRLPMRTRRYLAYRYRLDVSLRVLEQEWAALGDSAMSPEELFVEMNLARLVFPEATDWPTLVACAEAHPERLAAYVSPGFPGESR